MSNLNDNDTENIVFNFINNSVIASPDSITIPAFQFFATGWSWIFFQLKQALFNSCGSDWREFENLFSDTFSNNDCIGLIYHFSGFAFSA